MYRYTSKGDYSETYWLTFTKGFAFEGENFTTESKVSPKTEPAIGGLNMGICIYTHQKEIEKKACC